MIEHDFKAYLVLILVVTCSAGILSTERPLLAANLLFTKSLAIFFYYLLEAKEAVPAKIAGGFLIASLIMLFFSFYFDKAVSKNNDQNWLVYGCFVVLLLILYPFFEVIHEYVVEHYKGIDFVIYSPSIIVITFLLSSAILVAGLFILRAKKGGD